VFKQNKCLICYNMLDIYNKSNNTVTDFYRLLYIYKFMNIYIYNSYGLYKVTSNIFHVILRLILRNQSCKNYIAEMSWSRIAHIIYIQLYATIWYNIIIFLHFL